MASDPIECQVLVLRVSIHCEGCKKKVKKVLQTVHGVLRCDIDARSNKVVVTASTKLDPNTLVAKLRKSGKQAEPWPMPPAVAAAESQSQQETDDKNGNDDPTGNKPADKLGPDNAEASGAEPSSNPQPSPDEPDAGEAPKPAPERKAEPSSNTGADEAATGAVAPRQPDEAKRQAEERQPVDARVTVEYDDRGGGDDGYAMMNRAVPAPQHVLSYNMARPSPSASYYAAPPAAMAARPGPSQQGYIDEHYTPSYHGRSSSPYYYPPQQPSPYQQPASTEVDYNYNYDYYYSAPPQRSAFSPPRDGYGAMFDDENANSCAVM